MALLPPAPAHHSSPKTSRLGEMQREEMRALIFFFFLGGWPGKKRKMNPKGRSPEGCKRCVPPPAPSPGFGKLQRVCLKGEIKARVLQARYPPTPPALTTSPGCALPPLVGFHPFTPKSQVPSYGRETGTR